MITDLELRIAINRRLDLPLADAEWAYLDSQRWLADIRSGRLTVDAAAAKIEQMRAAFGTAPPAVGREKNGLPPDERMQALGAIIAQVIQAAAAPFVAKYLRGQLLTEDALPQWFKQQQAQDGEPTWIAEFAVKSLEDPRPAGPIRRLAPIEMQPPFPGPAVPVRAGGVLDQLRALSERFAQEHRISSAEACRTILTGLPPRIEAIRIAPHFSRIPAASRFHIEVDPAVTPAELGRAYRDARRKYMRGRVRRLSQKHLQLAAFMAGRPSGEKGADAMRAWNREFKRWRYKHVSNFLRDAAAASRRLLFPGGLDIYGGSK